MQEHSVQALCLSKIEGILVRTWDFLRLIPVRVMRILQHFWFRWRDLALGRVSFWKVQDHIFWIIELVSLILDLLGVAEIYETLCDVIKFNSRPLTASERGLAFEYFGEDLPYARIRIDASAFLGPKPFHFAYVGFCTINSWGGLTRSLLLHELVHIWQYSRLGSVYIPRALRAQYSDEGYDYGGVDGLLAALECDDPIGYFNLEQQADLLADYYRLKIGRHPRWIDRSKMHEDLFAKIIDGFGKTTPGSN